MRILPRLGPALETLRAAPKVVIGSSDPTALGSAMLRAGRGLEDAVLRAGIVRAKPIALTGMAAMIGAFFILDDPIFNGLAVSLIFGILVSTVLTLLVIPVLYYAYLKRRPASVAPQE